MTPSASGSAVPTPTPPAFSNGGDCPASSDPALPSDAGCVTSVTVGEEQLSVYALLNRASRPRSWHLHLRSGEREIDQRLHAGNDFSYPRAIGGSDVDLDGVGEWWVKVVDYTSHGAPWSGLNLFIRQGSGLVALSFEGHPLAINFGGISRLGEGAACRDGDLVLLRAEAIDRRNTQWTISERTFEVRGSRAHLLERRQYVLVIEDYNDPLLDPYFRVDCQGVTFTPF
ncbi:MAG TPA: hypothetical protein VNC78_10020 [Actinomycetota bacterium]|nr:hypothetical protein [Actinomycetota bacterium]